MPEFLYGIVARLGGLKFGGQSAVNGSWRSGGFLWRRSPCRVTRFGFARTPQCENTTGCRKHDKRNADLPPWNISEPAREHEEHPYNPTPDNPFKKIPLRVTFDVVVLAAEPTGFVAVWIVHNSKDWRNALAGSMSDLVVGIRLALCVLSKPDANTGMRSGEFVKIILHF